jgi:hypothetical protein
VEEEVTLMRSTKARPNFDFDLKFGQEKENELIKIFREETVECKTDKICQRTGNVFVEFEDAKKPSGISTTKATFYAFCLYKLERDKQIWVLIPTKLLKKLMKKYPIKNGGDNWEARGHIIPKEALLDYANN